jgi:hypothetical protein
MSLKGKVDAHCGEAHMIAENLIISCVEDIGLCVLGDNYWSVIRKFHV